MKLLPGQVSSVISVHKHVRRTSRVMGRGCKAEGRHRSREGGKQLQLLALHKHVGQKGGTGQGRSHAWKQWGGEGKVNEEVSEEGVNEDVTTALPLVPAVGRLRSTLPWSGELCVRHRRGKSKGNSCNDLTLTGAVKSRFDWLIQLRQLSKKMH